MSQVVKNERLAVRQKLVTIYKDQLDTAVREIDQTWASKCRLLDARVRDVHPYDILHSAVRRDCADGLILYDTDGRPLYPTVSADASNMIGSSLIWTEAWEQEFSGKDYARAAELYAEEAKYAQCREQVAALIAQTRCLAKLGKLQEAIETCRPIVLGTLEDQADADTLTLIANARLLLLQFTAQDRQYDAPAQQILKRLIRMLFHANGAGYSLPADQNLFMAEKALEIARQRRLLSPTDAAQTVPLLEKLTAAESRSIQFLDRFGDANAIEAWPVDTLQNLDAEGRTHDLILPDAKATDTRPVVRFENRATGDLIYGFVLPDANATDTPRVDTSENRGAGDKTYGFVHRQTDMTLLVFVTRDRIRSILAEYDSSFTDPYIDHRIIDESGELVSGLPEAPGDPFEAAPLGDYLAGWSIELYFKGGDVFERAANQRIAAYTWTGTLVIAMILASGAVAAKAVGKQVKLNRLKNDFIATVTHELKTPLASMRVLVDTLLEGNYRDQQQVTEYLQLVTRENERLSRLIDNFLTFSRMERNKKAFQMRPVNPALIASLAAEAIKTKFERGNCRFVTNIPDDLPAVTADTDAMVTVLVNLLDNAYKYSHDEKRIELKLWREDGHVCLSVSDNGVGIPRRVARRIFRSFYQVDRSLSRRAEGCGLGLSIAKFIVDAHRGTISVESKPRQGSTFTVKLPACEKL